MSSAVTNCRRAKASARISCSTSTSARIARSSGELEGIEVIEVGPGPGGLTRALLALGAKRVIAIEKDSRAIAALGEVAAHYPGRLEIIEADALEADLTPHLSGAPVRIVANLPYNIATALLVGWLTPQSWPPFWQSLTLMFQREVAERIVAAPGSDAYGRLGVLAGWRTKARSCSMSCHRLSCRRRK